MIQNNSNDPKNRPAKNTATPSDISSQPKAGMRLSGLFLFGEVSDRTRRYIPRDDPKTEIVTYTVETDRGVKYYVDEYAPATYHEIGEPVVLPVYVKTYAKKTGETSYTLMVQQQSPSYGEHF